MTTKKKFFFVNLIINPKYEYLRDFLANIDAHFETNGRSLSHTHSAIRLLDVGGLTLCVKHYGPTSWRKRLAVRIFRASKGKKSYYCAAELRERGFASQEPVAYVAYRHNLMDQNMYFVGVFSNYHHSLHEVVHTDRKEDTELVESFARYVARLHEDGFLPMALTPDNILFDRIDGRFHFSILDTGSIKCGRKVSIERGCRTLSALHATDAFNRIFIHAYAMARGANEEKCRKYANTTQ